jgi:hypothetical protein
LKTAATLIFISLVGPPINEFNPENHVKEWLKKVNAMQTTLLAQLLRTGHTKYSTIKISGKFSKRHVKHITSVLFFQNQSSYNHILEKKSNTTALVTKISLTGMSKF